MGNRRKCENCSNGNGFAERNYIDNAENFVNEVNGEFANNCRKDECESKFIEKGLQEIRRGIVDFEKALEALHRCDVTETTLDVLEGICCEEVGIDDVLKGLLDVQFHGNCKGLCDIRKGIHDIEEGIKDERKAIKDINHGCMAKGEQAICRGIKCCEKGLCEIIEGLEDIAKEDEVCCD